jgi:hypothetical protein
MQATSITDNLIQLTRLHFVNAFLVREDDGFTLIDTTTGGGAEALIAGDTFTAYGDLAVSDHFYWRFPFAAMATWDKGKDLESARALRALDPAVLVVGHGPATRQPGDAMDRAIERAPSASS